MRVAWVGTSQTYGTGSETVLESFVARIQGGLRAALRGRASVDTVNLAVPGWHSGLLLPRLRSALPRLRPDLVVVQLGNNDFDPSKLEQNVRAMAALVRSSGARLALVLEANAPLHDHRRLRENHEALRRVASAEQGCPVFDLHGHVNEDGLRDVGFLAWDDVHFTSLGQAAIADFLSSRLLPIIEEVARSYPGMHTPRSNGEAGGRALERVGPPASGTPGAVSVIPVAPLEGGLARYNRVVPSQEVDR